jgi:site-specific DNA recombinase
MMQVFQDAGVSLVSLQENFDFTTPIGRMVFRLLASMAEFYADNLGSEIRKANIEMAHQGYWHGKTPPPGYRMVEGKLTIDDKEKATVARAWELFLSGIWTIPQIWEQLPREGLYLYDKEGKAYEANPHVLNLMFHNRLYCSEIVLGHKGIRKYRPWERKVQIFPGKHEAYITGEQFERAREILESRSKGGKGSHIRSHQYIFGSGILRCSACGSPLIAHNKANTSGKTHTIVYFCSHKNRGMKCDADKHSIRETDVLNAMQDVIEKTILTGWDEKIRQGAALTHVKVSTGRREKLMAKRERLSKLYLNGNYDEEAFWVEDAKIRKELEHLPVAPPTPAQVKQAQDFIGEFPPLWQLSSPERKRDILRLLYREIIVNLDTNQMERFRPMPDFAMFFDVDPDGYVRM